MSMIGHMNTRIQILKRSEVGDFADPFLKDVIDYTLVLDTWAEANYEGTTKKFGGRAVGDSTGVTYFTIRNPQMEIEKDHYVVAEGYKYQVEGTMLGDGRKRFLILNCSFVGLANDGG